MKVELDRKVADLNRSEEYKKNYMTFTVLGVPQRVKNTYHDLTANARLTLFLAQTNGIKVEQPKEE